MIQIEFIGAARSVTGSKHLIRTSKAAVLLDCGLFQGRRKEAYEKNINLPIDPSSLTAIVLSHSHIDHSGALPSIYRKGYRGPIYSTHATRDLCTPMLIDTAWIMKADSDHIDKLIAEGARNLDSMPPIYNEADVVGALRLFIGLPYHVKHPVAPGIDVTFIDAGHILGSAITILDINEDGRSVRLAFTGDLGRKHLPLLRDLEVPSGVTHLISESTYGDRLHDPIEAMGAALGDVIVRTVARGGKVIIPSFALERAQEIIFSLRNLLRDGRIPKIPVYVDSPLTVKITDIFKLHPECLDQDSYKMLHGENNIFDFDGLTYISSVEDSKRISESREPAIVISASGMCEGGRILHHLRGTIQDKKNTVLIVGFQAKNTLGRKLVEGLPEVKIFGALLSLKAEVVVLNGFSGHADQQGLLNFAESVRRQGRLERIMLVHGEIHAQEILKDLLNSHNFKSVEIPEPGDRMTI